jgi:hypothetical protein
MELQRQLYESRVALKREMQIAMRCTRKKQKIDLAKSWKAKYSAQHYAELINLARNKEAAWEVANWTDERMGKPV